MSLVQAVANDNGAGGTTCQVTIAASAANQLIAFTGRGSQAATSISDNLGGTWTKVGGLSGQSSYGAIWYRDAKSAGVTTVTANYSSSQASTIVVAEEDGLAASPADKSAFATITTTATFDSGATPTTAQADEVLYGMCSVNAGGVSYSGDAPWSALTGTGLTAGLHENTTDGDTIFVCRRVVSATGTYSFTGSCTNGINTAAAIATFKLPAASGRRRGGLIV